MNPWVVIVPVAIGTFVFRCFGVLLPRDKALPPWLSTRLTYVAPAVLAGLIVASTFGGAGRTLAVDERAAGVAVGAAVAFLLRVPPLVAVIAAAATTALVRLAA